jgi:uncharacterized membrane protein
MLSPAIVAFDLAAVSVLTYGIYFRRHRRPDMLVAYLALNVAVMFLTSVLATATLGAGFGLGLFGVLSIIRLRSSEIAQAEVAYYFVALVLGLICGIEPDPVWLAPVLGTLLVAAVGVGDHPRLHHRHRRQLVTLDSAITDEAQLRERLACLFHAEVQGMVVLEVDLIRDMTVVDVRYRRQADQTGRATPYPTSPSAASAFGLPTADISSR